MVCCLPKSKLEQTGDNSEEIYISYDRWTISSWSGVWNQLRTSPGWHPGYNVWHRRHRKHHLHRRRVAGHVTDRRGLAGQRRHRGALRVRLRGRVWHSDWFDALHPGWQAGYNVWHQGEHNHQVLSLHFSTVCTCVEAEWQNPCRRDGRRHPSGVLEFGLARFTANGVLDTTFGTDGVATTNFVAGLDAPTAFLLQPNGQILMAGFKDGGKTSPGSLSLV